MRVARHDDAAAAALEEARAGGLFVIARFQDLLERTVVVSDGVLERVAETRVAGVGLHVFTEQGWSAFASSDDCSREAVGDMVRRAGRLARASTPYGPEATHAVLELRGGRRRTLPRREPDLGLTPPRQHAQLVVEANQAAPGRAEGVPIKTSFVAADDEWRVVRSDGADVSFATPRGYLRHDLTVRADGTTSSVSASVAGARFGRLLTEGRVDLLRRRAARALATARAQAGAPAVREGPYRVALDHALAKGLAHEAFGHAAETDVAPISFLSDGSGHLRRGERFGPDAVSIVDGPIEEDFANQPVSANGLDRETVFLVRDGVLDSGLGDLFSAERAGVPPTGACRTGRFRQAPTPRMSNIRIVVRDPLPFSGDAACPEPEEAAAALGSIGLCGRGQPLLLMLGYRGGQAHPNRGDFLFTSMATYDLSDGVAPRQAAVISGQSASALAAVLAGLGELRLDAMGICGKNGLNVSSSGGSHVLLVLEAHPDVVIGARR